MAERILHLIRNNTETSFFFAFGVGHFIGENSVVDLLRQKDIRVDRVPPNELIHRSVSFFDSWKKFISGAKATPEDNCGCDQYRLFTWFSCAVRCFLEF